MPLEKFAEEQGTLPGYTSNKYLTPGTQHYPIMKKYRANFVVERDEDGILCAADLEQGIFADGRTIEELKADILEAVECHFNIHPEDVERDVEINIPNLNSYQN